MTSTCWNCPAAAGPFLLDGAKVNGGLLAGAVSGLGADLLVAWIIWHNGGRPQPARPVRLRQHWQPCRQLQPYRRAHQRL